MAVVSSANCIQTTLLTMNFLNRLFSTNIGILVPRLIAGSKMTAKFSILGQKITETPLLLPKNVMVTPACGLKIKGQMRRRCKDCYYVRKEGRLYVMCPSFPRHKQTHLVKREKYTWIFSHACQSPLRPY